MYCHSLVFYGAMTLSTEHNDTEHDDTEHNDTQSNDIQH